jgi:hypothetical protein
MNKTHLLGILAFGGLATLMSCDSGNAGSVDGLDVSDCQVGTFRPVGLTDCVFPAVDVNGTPIGVSDNRCAFGQPAVPPMCVSDAGGRAYLSTSMKCAQGYRFEPGACNRNGPQTGSGTGSGTGIATGIAGSFETGAGSFGMGGASVAGAGGGFSAGQGEAGAPLGSAGADGTAGMSGTGSAGLLLDSSP